MIAHYIQEVIAQFSLRTLYLEMAWFATFGCLMHVFVVMALTRLPFLGLLKNIFRLQLMVIAMSYVVAPLLAAMSIVISSMLSVQYAMWFMGQQVYIWFAVCMMFFASIIFCQIFATISCARFRWWIFITNIGVAVLGFFVLKSMNLLILHI